MIIVSEGDEDYTGDDPTDHDEKVPTLSYPTSDSQALSECSKLFLIFFSIHPI